MARAPASAIAPLSFAAPAMDGIKNPINVTIPAARISDCLLNPGGAYDFNGKRGNYPDIRLVYWAGGNPFHHHQDTNKLRRAWQRPETVVVHEPWWTATARHADIVLPATTSLERNDIGGARRDKFIMAMQQAVAPVGEARNDFAIFSDLAQRLGVAEAYTQGPRRERRGCAICTSDAATAPAPTPRRCRTSTRSGTPAIWKFPPPARNTCCSATSAPIPKSTSCARHPARSSSTRKKSRASATTTARRIRPGSSRGNGSAATDAKTYPLHLVSSQPRDRLHSQMDCGPVSAGGKVAGREAITINPADAKARGISDGDVVRVHNARGSCLAGAIVSDAVSAGVVKLSCGAWYDPADGSEQALCRHGNPNVLTRDQGTSKLGQGPSSATALVEVERYTEPLPPVAAFDPPQAVAAS